jgi:hypothetical protein
LFVSAETKSEKMTAHTSVSLTASSIPEFQVSAAEQLTFPCLQEKNNALMEDNNVTLNFGADVSPVHILASASAIWTPVAFFNISAGAKLGTGWNYTMFGSRMSGLGLYKYDAESKPEEFAAGKGADGVYWTGFFGATLQFDAAALWPGKWRHIVGQVYNEISYQQYTKAHGSDIWYWTNNVRPNENSFLYYFNAVLAYRMPIMLDMAGAMFQIVEPFYNPAQGRIITELSAEETAALMLDFRFREDLHLMLMPQLMNKPKQPLTKDCARKWGFYRVAAVLTYKIR